MSAALTAALLTGGSSLLGFLGNIGMKNKAWNEYKSAKSDLSQANTNLQNSIDWRKSLYSQAAQLIYGQNSMFGSQSSVFGEGGKYWGVPNAPKGYYDESGIYNSPAGQQFDAKKEAAEKHLTSEKGLHRFGEWIKWKWKYKDKNDPDY